MPETHAIKVRQVRNAEIDALALEIFYIEYHILDKHPSLRHVSSGAYPSPINARRKIIRDRRGPPSRRVIVRAMDMGETIQALIPSIIVHAEGP